MIRQPIRVMPADLTLKIAAGEVVERPASVVKELIDNAIDAGARHIQVDIQGAGLHLIRVIDDGAGIPTDELKLAFTAHATSKVTGVHDLESLGTLGFRGEALAAMASISRIDVQTRAREESVGSAIRIEYGRVVAQGPAASPIGTRISVSDLFGNVPARRKFVRSLRAESGQIQQVVVTYALAQPEMAFSLTLDRRLTLHTPGTRSTGDAIAAAYDPAMLSELIELEWEEAGVRIDGMIGTPALTRPNRSSTHVSVNGRPIQNRALGFVIGEAYRGLLMTGRHPVAVIHLHLPFEDVDPNIHPAKSEVRFTDERAVNGALYRAISARLLELGMPERELSMVAAESTLAGSMQVELPFIPLPRTPTGEAAPASSMAVETATAETGLAALPALRVFGQTNQAFIVAEGPRGLYMIDQHAAHERILFDRLDEQCAAGNVPAQPLLDPEAIELSPDQMATLDGNQDLLRRSGFIVEPFGQGSVLLRSIPTVAKGKPADLVREVLDELQTTPSPEAARERALAVMACHGAVRAGQTLAVAEMRSLIEQLEATARPATCPHGRPTMIHLSHLQLAREFGRR